MALHTLKIVVVDGGRAENYVTSGGQKSGTKQTVVTEQRMKEKIALKFSPTEAYGMVQAGRLAMQTAKSAFSYYMGDIGRRSGDSHYQARVNRAFEVGGQVVSLVHGAISGGMAGSVFGGLGAIIGGLAGFASSAMSMTYQHAEKTRAYNHTMAEEKAGRDYQIGRMTGGTGVRLR